MLTIGLSAYVVFRQQTQFILTLMIGLYISVLIFMISDHWLGELGEALPVLPMAELLNSHMPRTKHFIWRSFMIAHYLIFTAIAE